MDLNKKDKKKSNLFMRIITNEVFTHNMQETFYSS